MNILYGLYDYGMSDRDTRAAAVAAKKSGSNNILGKKIFKAIAEFKSS